MHAWDVNYALFAHIFSLSEALAQQFLGHVCYGPALSNPRPQRAANRAVLLASRAALGQLLDTA